MSSPLVIVGLILLPYMIFAISLYLKDRGHPLWLSRKLVHIVGICAASLYAAILPFNEILIVFGVVFGVLFLSAIPPLRLPQTLFKMGASAREGEEDQTLLINNILTYLTLTTIFFLFQDYKFIFLAAALAVGLGDGMGEIIGRPFGHHAYVIFSEKSLEGSLGVFFGSLGGGLLSLALFDIFLPSLIILLVASSLIVVTIEALSFSFYDNVLIPIGASLFIWLGYRVITG